MSISTGCSSTVVALEAAVSAIDLGRCDAAIVAGTTIQVTPVSCMDFFAMHALSPDGRCKAFDETGNFKTKGNRIIFKYYILASLDFELE